MKNKTRKIGIIMNGVTGRMGKNQHLLRSVKAIMDEGGIVHRGEILMPDPILIGRNIQKLEALAKETGISKYSNDLDEVLGYDGYSVYFDALITGLRVENVKKAVKAGKHIYCEKPTAADTRSALELYHICRDAGVKHGVVQDKLWLPGILKLKRLIENGFFGKILSVRGDFGYWVFEGHSIPAQRPSWNYRKESDGGIILDMFPHWRYVLDNLFGEVKSVSCIGSTDIPERVNEEGKPYKCTADDAAYGSFMLEGGIIAQFNSSWVTRVRRDDLLVLQVDGTLGSAVAGLRECYTQHYGNTPRPVWNPDISQPIDFYDGWLKVPPQEDYKNAFRAQWELFLKHVAFDEPFPWDLLEGARGVQLAESGYKSWEVRRWIDIEILKK
ncbi:MAG: Gfo/Idh/MocA family oxidoreductase [Bacteroidales bacterium]|nr:Gfo/Idh/MocA family oxidoreductase [Bacteroidales bacterium]